MTKTLKAFVLPVAWTAATIALAGDEPAPVHATIGDDGVQRVEIAGGSYYFEPAHIVVRVGMPVELTLRYRSGFVAHDFRLDAPEAGIDVHEELTHQAATVRFTPTQTGSFTFYCSKDPPLLGSHRDRDMEGTLEVVD
jgi:plastocyanin